MSEVFVGRELELAQVVSLLLGRARLITLLGPGGIGKTSLAAEALRRYRRSTQAPVHWVRLARLAAGSDTDMVTEEILQAVVEADFSGRTSWESLTTALRPAGGRAKPRRSLLVMDNCEHVLRAAGEVVSRLLAAVPQLTILTTSREAIDWVDEYRVVVPPLSRRDAIELFRRRSEMVGHPMRGDSQDHTIGAICRHLDNNPLFIRLAAARLIRRSPAAVLRELSAVSSDDRRMDWTHGAQLGVEIRHRRVGDVIKWSYDLCPPEEQLLFERLSVFAAGTAVDADDATDLFGADVAAIEAICADDPRPGRDRKDESGRTETVALAATEIRQLLDRLCDRSLLTVHIESDTVRYSLLESLHLFAQRRLRLRSSGGIDESARLARRHIRYYRDQVMDAAAHWFGPVESEWQDWAQAAWDNILTAVERSLSFPGEAVAGLEICAGVLALQLPFRKGSLREARRLTEQALCSTHVLSQAPVELRISTRALTAWIALCQGELDEAERLLAMCVEACAPESDLRESWRSTPEIDTGLPAAVEFAWGNWLFVLRDTRSTSVLCRARAKFDRVGDDSAASISELIAALSAALLGPADQAVALASAYLDHADASGTSFAKGWADLVWAIALTKHGDASSALKPARRALALQLSRRDEWGALWSVQARAWALARIVDDGARGAAVDRGRMVEQATEIAQLIGGTATLRTRLGIDITGLGPFQDETVNAVQIARKILGARAFATAEANGRSLRPETHEVHQLALGTLSPARLSTAPGERQHAPWQRLTRAERDVAVLAAAGWPNSAIAVRRGSSPKTVDAQVAATLQKLAIPSREHIITSIPPDLADRVDTEAARRPPRGQPTA
ncbi:ATP-binding protein [Nocardia gipuzkoensis]|uniref:ATP-binding protein n=1 Tax=Nocardia gipuzkoensis TaxID=2749991 RepID=UPI0015EFBCD0|nr:AAA family ATPase [Nocardia gipuzkoensis]